MKVQGLVAVAGVLLCVGPACAQTASEPLPVRPAASLMLLLDSPASAYTVPVLLDHPKVDFSGCGKSPKRFVFMLEVEKNGSVGNVRVASRAQDKCLTKAALAAVHSYRFTPGQRSGALEVTHIALAVEGEESAAANGGGTATSDKPLPALALVIIDPGFTSDLIKANPNAHFHASFSIDTNGYVTNLRVLDAPNDELARIATRAVLQDRFWPAMKDGTPVKYDTSIEFSLDYSGR